MKRFSKFNRLRRRAFTLVELMTVIAIIGVIGAISFGVLAGGDSGYALNQGQRILGSLFENARNTAILKQTTAAVVINANPGDRENYLRQAGVVYSVGEGSSQRWVPAGGAVLLPRGVFYVPNGLTNGPPVEFRSDETVQAPDPADPTASRGTGPSAISFPLPGEPAEPFFMYSFSGNGRFLDGGAAKVVLMAGRRQAPEDPPAFENELNSTGFVVNRQGKVIYFNSPQELEKFE